MAQYAIPISANTYPLVFLMVDNTDHITGKTGLSPTVTISKNGGAFASPSGTVSAVGNGWYSVSASTNDPSVLGPLILHATGTSADPTDVVFEVVSYNPQDSVRFGLTALPNANANAANGLPTLGSGTGQITVSAGAISIDWAAITNKTAVVDLTQTIISRVSGDVGGSVGSVTGAVGSVTASVIVGSVSAGAITTNAYAAGTAVPANVIKYNSQTAVTDGNNYPSVNVVDIAGSASTGGSGYVGIDWGQILNKTSTVNLSATTTKTLTDLTSTTFSESSGVVGATATLKDALVWLKTLARNKITQTATTETLFADDGSTPVSTSTDSDDGTTFTRGKWS